MKIKTYSKLSEKKKIIKEFIQNNPNCTYKQIKKATKLKVERIYGNLKEAYIAAGVPFSKSLSRRNIEQRKIEVINYIRKKPLCSVLDINRDVRVNMFKTFGSILSAYKAAGVKYPERETISGVMCPLVVKRCHDYEKEIFSLLSEFGEVIPKVRTSTGIVDCLFNYNNETYAVEIKDYRAKNNITMYELKQLVEYMKTLNCQKGLLICHKSNFPKKKYSRDININNLSIHILSEEDLRERSTIHFN